MFSITVTHELGHNFGSEHDDVERYACAPGEYYLLYYTRIYFIIHIIGAIIYYYYNTPAKINVLSVSHWTTR